MNIFSYDRVSSDEQVKEGLNLKIKKDKYAKLGIKPENMYSDSGISGGFDESDELKIQITEDYFIAQFPLKKRPGFRALTHKLKNTPNSKLVFSKYDRIARSSSFGDLFFIWLKQQGIEWEALEDIDTHESPAMRRFLFAWANDRRDNDATNIDSQRKNLYDQGTFAYKSPFGYQRNKEGKLELDVPKCLIVANIFRETIQGTDYKEICKKYDIYPAQYYKIIKNKTYCGYTHHKGQWKKTEQVPTIITEEEYEKANSKKTN